MALAQTLRSLAGPFELIHEQAGPRLLRYARLGLISLWIFKLVLDPLWRLSLLPKEMLMPAGFLTLLSPETLHALFTPGALATLVLVTLAVLALCLTNLAFPLTCTVAAFLLTFYSCVIRSFGPPVTVHSDIVPLLGVYVMAAYAWADLLQARGRPDAARAWASYPLITLIGLLCTSYMLVGFNRLFVGTPEVFTSDTMLIWTTDASLRGYYFDTNIGWHVPEWPLVAFMLKAGLPVITFFEITAPLCLIWPRFRWLFIPTMLSFHLLSLVFMNIFFFDDMFLYLLLIDWSKKFPALRK